MKEEPNPPRLIQDPALRPLLLPEVERAISPERLAKNKAAIAKTVASGVGATAIIGTKGIAALVVIGSAGAWYLFDREEPAPQEPPPTVVAEPDSDIANAYKAIARQVAIKIAEKAKDLSLKMPTIKVSNT